MKQYKVTNRTQGRLELKDPKTVLEAGSWAIIDGELSANVKGLMGAGPHRKIDVIEIVTAPQKTASKGTPAPAVSTASAPAEAATADQPQGKPRDRK